MCHILNGQPSALTMYASCWAHSSSAHSPPAQRHAQLIIIRLAAVLAGNLASAGHRPEAK